MVHAVLGVLLGASFLQADERIQLRFDASQAEAVLAVVSKREVGHAVAHEDWQRLHETEPYQRLKQREAGVNRPFTDETFEEFVLSDELLKRAGLLRRTLDEWISRDMDASAQRVLAYLPPQARIRASVYVMIKPQPNSFVYDLANDPAIFLYLDPDVSSEKFENTVAHELHHIGYSSVAKDFEANTADLAPNIRMAVNWMGAFGEGFAMLAAAGNPDAHPHATSSVEERARWDRDMANFNEDVRALDDFFLDVIDERVKGEEHVRRRAMTFFGEQGPWYTVGYRMAVVLERRYGRDTLIASMLDPRQLLARYNTAAAELNDQYGASLALWSSRLLREIGAF